MAKKGKGKRSKSSSSSDSNSPDRNRCPKTPPGGPPAAASDPPITLPPPITSNVDGNEYKVIQMSNGMRVLLISETDSANQLPSFCQRHSHELGIQSRRMGKPFPSTFRRDLWPTTAPVNTTTSGNHFQPRHSNVSFVNPLNHTRKKKPKAPRNTGPDDITSCALTVNVGASDDPQSHCGLAHFLEHMVHLGSKKFPDEDAYFRWIMEHGVSFNAFTQTNTTTYYFGTFNTALETSIDLFSSMIAEPLLLEETVEREIESVDNEYLLKEHHPSWRYWKILATSAAEDHPLNSFSCGNLQSLKNGKEDVKELTKQLKALHQTRYVGSAMTLTIQSTLSLEELETLVTSFKKIPKGNGSIRRESPAAPQLLRPFDTPAFRKVNFIPNSHHFNVMWIAWPLPPDAWRDFQNKPLDFLSHLLSLEWEGGLFHTLRSSGLVLDVYAGCGRYELFRNEYTSLFELSLELTEGAMELRNIKTLIKTVFRGLQTIREMPIDVRTALWNEYYLMLKQEFQYSGPGSGDSFAISCSRLLQVMPSEEIFRREAYPSSKNFNELVFQETLGFFKPDRMNVSVCSSAFPESVTKVMGKKVVEKFTGTEYFQCSLNDLKESKSEDFLKVLQQSKKLEMKYPTCGNPFQLTKPPTSKVLKGFQFEAGKVKAEHFGNDQDKAFKALCIVDFTTASNCFNEKRQTLLAMLTQCVQQAVLPLHTDMQRGGVNVSVSQDPQSLVFQFHGLADSLVEAVRQLLPAVWNAMDNMDERHFHLIKESFVAGHRETLANPENVAMALVQEMFVKDQIHIDDGFKVLRRLEFRDLVNYSELFRNSCSGFVTLGGNIDVEESEVIGRIVSRLDFGLRTGDLSRLSIPEELTRFPLEDRCVRVRSSWKACGNTCVTNSYAFNSLIGRDQQSNLSDMVQFTGFLMGGASFWYLRTWKQLGYVVSVGSPQDRKVPTIEICVTGPATKVSACLVDEYMDSFLNVFWDLCLKDLDEDHMDQLKTMWGFGYEFTVQDLQGWYKHHVRPIIKRDESLLCSWDKATAVRLRASKLSVQVLGSDDERCKGHKRCGKPTGFNERLFNDGRNGKHLSFAEDKDPSDEYFISNIKAYKTLL